jgi:hypothetical protein
MCEIVGIYAKRKERSGAVPMAYDSTKMFCHDCAARHNPPPYKGIVLISGVICDVM